MNLYEDFYLIMNDIITGQSVRKNYKFLLKSQKWPKERLVAYQNKKLRELIEYSYEYVEFYTELFDKLSLKPSDINCREDLQKLPILDKETLRENVRNGKLVTNDKKIKGIYKAYSSGSTGEPVFWYQTKYSWGVNLACAIRAWNWMGYSFGDEFIKISSNKRKGLKKIQDHFSNCTYVYGKDLNDESFAKVVKLINKKKPKVIRGYVDQMFFLAEYINKTGCRVNYPIAIATTGSTLHKAIREKIMKAFNCSVYDSYHCEGGANLSQCKTGLYHSSMEYAITEIVDSHGEKASKGRIVTTDLHNYATPFIRYDSQDVAEKADLNCSCGYQLDAFSRIFGRDTDILITPKGKFLIYSPFAAWFEYEIFVKQFQVIQEKIDLIIIKIVVEENTKRANIEKVRKYWGDYIGDGVEVFVEVVKDIPPAPSGKRRYLIRNKDIILPI